MDGTDMVLISNLKFGEPINFIKEVGLQQAHIILLEFKVKLLLHSI